MVKVIAEIGINHNGNLEKALRLIEFAKTSGCWGVKFQFRGSDFFACNDEMGSTLIREELVNSNLNFEWIQTLSLKAKSEGLKIGYSFFSTKDLEFFLNQKNWSLDFIKIPSPEFRNINLIEKAKNNCSKVMISYGGGNEEEIHEFIQRSNLRSTDAVFHCISNYPTIQGNQQLEFLNRIGNNTNAQIGYSSHDRDWEINLIAASLYNIEFIERHLCESKLDIGLDISTSSDPIEFKKLNEILENLEAIKSCKMRYANQGEILNIRNLGTSLYAKKNLKIGEFIDLDHLEEKSPSIGITLEQFTQTGFKQLKRAINKGEPLLSKHFDDYQNNLTSEEIQFAERFKLSLPVRLHDFKSLSKKFKITHYELHLSYKELDQLIKEGTNDLLGIIQNDYTVSIHLPDYISKDYLINPFSENLSIRKRSRKLIESTINLSQQIEAKTGKKSIILGSFSMNEFESKEGFYENFKKFIDLIEHKYNVTILAQWLPKIAWYFGGSIKVDLFCTEKDIELCLKHDIPICLDIAHLILSANFYNIHWKEWYDKLIPLCKHIHLSDAVGVDGEGVAFGQGDIHSLEEILQFPSIKVLEIWEGHLDEGKKFYEALNFLLKKQNPE